METACEAAPDDEFDDEEFDEGISIFLYDLHIYVTAYV